LQLQISPQLEESPVLSSEAALTGVAPVSLEAAHQQWGKADAYYYMGIARMQRLWEVLQSPLTFKHLSVMRLCSESVDMLSTDGSVHVYEQKELQLRAGG